MANRPKFTAKKERKFLSVLARTGNVTHAARSINMSRRGLYNIREINPEFQTKWDDAVEQSVDLLELEARRRAFKGTVKPVFYQGVQCGRIREYSDSLIMFLIKGKRPEYATERKEVSGRDGRPIPIATISAEDLTDEQLAAIIGTEGD